MIFNLSVAFTLCGLLSLILAEKNGTNTHTKKFFTIVCVGDSITFGSGASNPLLSYPARLLSKLKHKYYKETRTFVFKLHNYGASGTTVTRYYSSSYWDTSEYKQALSHSRDADVVIILFGANDAQFHLNWNERNFKRDYTEMIESFQKFESKPLIYVGIPTVILPFYLSTKTNSTIINGIYPSLIRSIAEQTHCKIIDFFSAVGGAGTIVSGECIQFFAHDGLHPNDKGHEKMANAAFETIQKDLTL